MRILVTGVSGYLGSRVAARLLGTGHDVRGLARRPESVAVDDLRTLAGDVETGAGLAEAMDGAEVAYFLIHAMESGPVGRPAADPFPEREARAARRFAQAAAAAGVRRIVYLGGPQPPGEASAHLDSRLAVERELLGAIPDSIALRASIVVGAGSRSFALLVRLLERLPVIALPAWSEHRTAPIDERDVLAMLVHAADARLGAAPSGHVLDAAGPEVVSYRELLARVAELMLIDRPALSLRALSLTPVASVVAAAVAGEDPALVRPLMESLQSDLLASGRAGARELTVRLHSLDSAIEHALREWEDSRPLAAR